ncbi:MAG: histidine ammonia-lyase [Caldisericaceae bacterium]|nr:histidine ammonia-lyase [Caldisericaceae bacterium]
MIKINDEKLSLEEIESVADNFEEVQLTEEVLNKINASSEYIEEIVKKGKIIYGVTTGFGKLYDRVISEQDIAKLQENLLKSHASGIGDPLSEREVRAAIVVRANSLARGYSGIRRITIEKLIDLLNYKIYPYVPSYGSLGASGDLAPLAHIALLIIGRGKVIRNGIVQDALPVLKEKNIEPLDSLKAKEGLALINGTAVEAGIASLLLTEAKYIFFISLKAASLSMEALRARKEAFDLRIQRVRIHAGQEEVAKFVLDETIGSKLINSISRIQDAYSIRCIPSVYGAILDNLKFIEDTLTKEVNAVTDNPIVFEKDDDILSGGNFHGESIAFAMDLFGIIVSEIGSITERRINRLLNPALSEGLPAFLIKDAGLNSGLMILQYTAAALASENKILCHPASVDSIPVSADQEDHVSMGMNAVLKAKKILENVERIVAIELFVAAQAIDFVDEKLLGRGTSRTYQTIRKDIAFAEEDREFSYDISKLYTILKTRNI